MSDSAIDRRSPSQTPQLMFLGPNFTIHRNSAQQAGVAPIFDRILSELSVKMRRLGMDKAELSCLKAVILFNPGEGLLRECLGLLKSFCFNTFFFCSCRYPWTQVSE